MRLSASGWSAPIRLMLFGFVLSALATAAVGQGAAGYPAPSQNNAANGQQTPNGANSTQTPVQPTPSQPASSQPQPTAQAPTANDQGMFVFKKQVEEVVLHATVLDADRHLVTGLKQNDFTVLEDGKPQTITSFRQEDVPVAMGIVIDNSGSMRDKRQKVNDAVLDLIHASNPQDQVFVVNFSKNYYLDQDFTSNVNLLQAALHQVSSSGSTALYDAIVASAVHLRNDPRVNKRVLLVITDGQDNMSQETLQEASRRLQQLNGPTLYAIGLVGGGLEGAGRDALEQLAAETGGVAYFPETLDEVNNITRTVAHDIRSQYMIAYRPSNQNSRPGYQSVQVEANAPGYGPLTVRTMNGYYPPESSH